MLYKCLSDLLWMLLDPAQNDVDEQADLNHEHERSGVTRKGAKGGASERVEIVDVCRRMIGIRATSHG